VELLSDFDASDPVSAYLRLVRIRSTVYCRSIMRAPWGFGVEAHGSPAFHVVTAGSCWLEVDGDPEQLLLDTGDLVILPAGPRHWLRDEPHTVAPELEDILRDTPPDKQSRLRLGGSGRPAELLCGGFTLEGGDAHPILRALPSAFRICGVGGRPVSWLAATLELLNAEAASEAPGSEEVASRLADALLTQALRVALAELQSTDAVGVRALRDPQIAAAIGLVHRERERAWTVGEVAGEVGLSRSAFAARFRHLVGESPKRYITRTRLAHAAALLRSAEVPIAEIAARAGYASEFSFGKAFKRTFGIAPGAYRGQPNAVPEPRLANRAAGAPSTRHHVELTPAGDELLPAGDELLRRGQQLLADRSETVERVQGVGNGAAGLIRAGVALLTEHEVGPVLSNLIRTRPELLLDRSAAISERLVANLREGRLDAAIVHQVPLLASIDDVAWEPLRRGRLAAVLPSSHKLAACTSIRLEELKDETFIAYPRALAPSAYEGLTLMCQQFGGFEPQLLESPTASALPLGDDSGLIRGGTAIALLTERAARAHTPEHTTVVAIEPPPTFAVALAWRCDDSSPGLLRFLDLVRSFRDHHGWLSAPG
jgi:AraC-like DNA-binding protein